MAFASLPVSTSGADFRLNFVGKTSSKRLACLNKSSLHRLSVFCSLSRRLLYGQQRLPLSYTIGVSVRLLVEAKFTQQISATDLKTQTQTHRHAHHFTGSRRGLPPDRVLPNVGNCLVISPARCVQSISPACLPDESHFQQNKLSSKLQTHLDFVFLIRRLSFARLGFSNFKISVRPSNPDSRICRAIETNKKNKEEEKKR